MIKGFILYVIGWWFQLSIGLVRVRWLGWVGLGMIISLFFLDFGCIVEYVYMILDKHDGNS